MQQARRLVALEIFIDFRRQNIRALRPDGRRRLGIPDAQRARKQCDRRFRFAVTVRNHADGMKPERVGEYERQTRFRPRKQCRKHRAVQPFEFVPNNARFRAFVELRMKHEIIVGGRPSDAKRMARQNDQSDRAVGQRPDLDRMGQGELRSRPLALQKLRPVSQILLYPLEITSFLVIYLRDPAARGRKPLGQARSRGCNAIPCQPGSFERFEYGFLSRLAGSANRNAPPAGGAIPVDPLALHGGNQRRPENAKSLDGRRRAQPDSVLSDFAKNVGARGLGNTIPVGEFYNAFAERPHVSPAASGGRRRNLAELNDEFLAFLRFDRLVPDNGKHHLRIYDCAFIEIGKGVVIEPDFFLFTASMKTSLGCNFLVEVCGNYDTIFRVSFRKIRRDRFPPDVQRRYVPVILGVGIQHQHGRRVAFRVILQSRPTRDLSRFRSPRG